MVHSVYSFMHNFCHALFFAITLGAPTRVYIDQTITLLTCFTVSSVKARLTFAPVFMMDIFITCSSVFTLVIFVTMQFYNTSLYVPLLLRPLCTSLTKSTKLPTRRARNLLIFWVSFVRPFSSSEARISALHLCSPFHYIQRLENRSKNTMRRLLLFICRVRQSDQK